MVSALGYFVSRFLTGPIVELSGTMRKVSGGDYGLRAKQGRKDEIGELAGTFNTMMDRLEDARFQSEMYLDLMGHDINNLNQVALGYLQMAEEKIESGAPVEKADEMYIRKPLEALEDSTRLIENIRKLRRAKTEDMRTKAFDVRAVLAKLREQYSHVPGRDIRVELDCPGKCEVLANDLIKDIFSNLIWNAIKHSAADRPLVVSLRVTDYLENGIKYCQVAVEDNGPGISDELKERIFTRFSRGRTRAKGSGLGLYLVKSLVESYRGRVWVENRVSGDHTRGSRFVVMIPSI
jgi:signal transduction histidine kinase